MGGSSGSRFRGSRAFGFGGRLGWDSRSRLRIQIYEAGFRD